MKKKLVLLTVLATLSAATLIGCGEKTDKSADKGAEASVAGSEIAPESREDAEVADVLTDADIASAEDAAGTADASQYIGMTIDEFIADGNQHSGYNGFNGQYEFTAMNESEGIVYKLVLSDDVVDIMEKKEFSEDYEDLIGSCTIVEIESQVADDEKLQSFVGKTLKDVEAAGIDVSGYMSSSNITMMAYDGMLQVYIEFSEADTAIYEAMNDPDIDDVIEAYSDCAIESIYYMMY